MNISEVDWPIHPRKQLKAWARREKEEQSKKENKGKGKCVSWTAACALAAAQKTKEGIPYAKCELNVTVLLKEDSAIRARQKHFLVNQSTVNKQVSKNAHTARPWH